MIELLVVIAIIGVLVGLTVPAVQSAREASRRIACQNNLKQIGLALSGYASNVDAYPIGYIAWPNPPGGAAPGWAWSATLLGLLEQGPVYDALNINLPIDVPANLTVRISELAIFVCPSDRETGEFRVTSQVVSGPVSARTTSYAANGGTEDARRPNGLFQMNQSVRLRDIKDGATNTFAVGERGAFVVQNAWPGALARIIQGGSNKSTSVNV